MAPERDEVLYLVDMRDAVEKILRYTAAGHDALFSRKGEMGAIPG